MLFILFINFTNIGYAQIDEKYLNNIIKLNKKNEKKNNKSSKRVFFRYFHKYYSTTWDEIITKKQFKSLELELEYFSIPVYKVRSRRDSLEFEDLFKYLHTSKKLPPITYVSLNNNFFGFV